jgi:hypothetical protein
VNLDGADRNDWLIDALHSLDPLAGQPVQVDQDRAHRVARDARAAASSGHPRRRRWVAGALFATLAAGGGTIAWAVSRHDKAPDPTQIACHQRPDLKSSIIALANNGEDPLAQCTSAWRKQMPDWGPPPTMIACVSPTGIIAVVPGDDATCATLGLAKLDQGIDDQQRILLAFEDSVTTEVGEMGCVLPERVKQIVEKRLVQFALNGWTVSIVGRFDSTQPCGGIGFDVPGKRIEISPISDPNPTTTKG